MSLFTLSKRIVAKKMELLTGAAVVHDPASHLPFNARIGSILELVRADFALLSGTLVRVPEAAQQPIVAVSRVKLAADENLRLHRLYTSTGKNRRGEGAAFVQVLTQAEDPDTIVDLAYYQFLCRQFPSTAEEQAAYQGQGSGLGERTYWMGDDQLTALGLSADAIKSLLGETDALEFTRDTPTAEDYTTPFEGLETRLDEASGERGLQRQVWFMPYTRVLTACSPGAIERLLISFEVLVSMDGRELRGVQVDFLTGVQLDPARVRVL